MRWRRAAVATAATITGVGAAALFAAGRRVSDLAVRPPHSYRGTPDAPDPGTAALTVAAVGDGTVTLDRGPGADAPGRYALLWPGGRALVGGPVAADEDTVTRPVLAVGSGVLHTGQEVRPTVEVHTGDPASALGLAFRDVAIEGELGPLPCWYVPGARDTWVVAVHGLGTTRAVTLNTMRTLAEFGTPVVSITHRGDAGAPAAPGGLGRLGATEWRDVVAAVRRVREAGARRVVLYGWSTGATAALHATQRGEVRDVLAGLILDSPVLDWKQVLRGRAEERRVPRALVPLGVWAAEGRAGLSEPDRRHPDAPGPVQVGGPAEAEEFRLAAPSLLFQGTADALADQVGTARLAARFPELATYVTVDGAVHQGPWNAAPGRYQEALRRFLTPVV